jgi:hypothetical protein
VRLPASGLRKLNGVRTPDAEFRKPGEKRGAEAPQLKRTEAMFT